MSFHLRSSAKKAIASLEDVRITRSIKAVRCKGQTYQGKSTALCGGARSGARGLEVLHGGKTGLRRLTGEVEYAVNVDLAALGSVKSRAEVDGSASLVDGSAGSEGCESSDGESRELHCDGVGVGGGESWLDRIGLIEVFGVVGRCELMCLNNGRDAGSRLDTYTFSLSREPNIVGPHRHYCRSSRM